MNIHDEKKRGRIYTHHIAILDSAKFISLLPGWNIKKLNEVLESLKQKEVIEINDNEIRIFYLPISQNEDKHLPNNDTMHQSLFTNDESELITLLTIQSTVSF